ncbi:elongin-C-like [Adelges cooleyi]|uniref:elongin-C-like n=1 Tax=Adelges cooleyi TaxID=133065 RepID=UPI00217FB8F5|nr:elongin-C-like [Adelges cooleyi]
MSANENKNETSERKTEANEKNNEANEKNNEANENKAKANKRKKRGGDGKKPVYGGCEGPDAMYIKLISSDDHEFIIKREHAMTSETIKAMLSGPGQFSENQTNMIHFKDIPSHVLKVICLYFAYKLRYTDSSCEVPEFPIPTQSSLEILMAANFLDC